MLKFAAVVTYASSYNVQVSPFFANALECSQWCEANKVNRDVIQGMSNYEEVQRWQADPAYPIHYCPQGPWPIMS